jgi:hypothetical protein
MFRPVVAIIMSLSFDTRKIVFYFLFYYLFIIIIIIIILFLFFVYFFIFLLCIITWFTLTPNIDLSYSNEGLGIEISSSNKPLYNCIK